MKFNSVVFVHVPRTSGTYIEKQLCKKFGCRNKWPAPNLENLFFQM
jgi:hypothetical protein